MITLAKEGSIKSRRRVDGFIYEDLMAQKLFYELAERYCRFSHVSIPYSCRYRTRTGGYTRIVRDGFRLGDGAPMALLELVDRDKGPKIPLPAHPSIPKSLQSQSGVVHRADPATKR